MIELWWIDGPKRPLWVAGDVGNGRGAQMTQFAPVAPRLSFSGDHCWKLDGHELSNRLTTTFTYSEWEGLLFRLTDAVRSFLLHPALVCDSSSGLPAGMGVSYFDWNSSAVVGRL